MYNSRNAYSFLETASSIVKLGLKDPQKHLQRRRNMRDAASVVEMLSALPYQQVKGGECVAERRARAREERWGGVREPGTRKGKEARAKEEERRRLRRHDERERAGERELETRFASCRHLEAISYRFTRTPRESFGYTCTRSHPSE